MKLKSLKEEVALFSNGQFILSTNPKEKNDWWRQFVISLTYLPIIKAYGYSRYIVAFCRGLKYTIDLESEEIWVNANLDQRFEEKVSKFYNEIEDIPYIRTFLINILQ